MIDCFPATEGIAPVLGKMTPLRGQSCAGEVEAVHHPRGSARKPCGCQQLGDEVNSSLCLIFKIKISLAVIPIITELHQQPNYHCVQHVIPWVGSIREEEGL